MKIAVEGCSHGELDTIYAAIQHMEKQHNFKVDVLLCCGDFQSVRNKHDLECMAVPAKYRRMQDFHRYYSGEKVAPILTIFIGGNHEASSYLAELPYGGWVCPNIYYMGYASVIRIGDLRIGGLSGIYKGFDYLKGHFECLPYSEDTKRSTYHIRNIDVFRLKQLSGSIDIFMSHDWPRGIYWKGNVKKLLQRKPFFQKEVEQNTLGSRPAEEILAKLQPSYWFSAHLHVRFAALVDHEETSKTTKFLALDKCLPRRNFLQILDLPNSSDNLRLQYDPEWLSILQSTNHLLSIKNSTQYMPGPGCEERWNFTPTPEELDNINKLFDGNFQISLNFERTAEPFSSTPSHCRGHVNPQTTKLCESLGIDDPNALLLAANKPNSDGQTTSSGSLLSAADDVNSTFVSLASLSSSINPDEISLDNDDEDDDVDEGNDNAAVESTPTDDVAEKILLSSGLSFVVDSKPDSFVAPEYLSRDSNRSNDSELSNQSSKRTNDTSDESLNSRKVFKRRNQAMYTKCDEDDDESS